MEEWTKFKNYIDPNAHKRVIDVHSDHCSKKHSRAQGIKKVEDQPEFVV